MYRIIHYRIVYIIGFLYRIQEFLYRIILYIIELYCVELKLLGLLHKYTHMASVIHSSAHGPQSGQITSQPKTVTLLPALTSIGKSSFSHFIFPSLKNAGVFTDPISLPWRHDL